MSSIAAAPAGAPTNRQFSSHYPVDNQCDVRKSREHDNNITLLTGQGVVAAALPIISTAEEVSALVGGLNLIPSTGNSALRYVLAHPCHTSFA